LQTFQIYQAGDLKPIHVPKRCVSRLFIPNKADMTRYLVTAQTHGRIGGKSVPEPKLPPIKSLLCAGHCGVTSPVTASELVKPTVPTKELGAMSNASDFFALYKARKGTENSFLLSLSLSQFLKWSHLLSHVSCLHDFSRHTDDFVHRSTTIRV
jgi:hypothetical protein